MRECVCARVVDQDYCTGSRRVEQQEFCPPTKWRAGMGPDKAMGRWESAVVGLVLLY